MNYSPQKNTPLASPKALGVSSAANPFNFSAETLARDRIKELRARYDMTQDDLARKVGVRRETILYLEKGKYKHSLLLAHQIAQTLKTTIEDLFIFEE